MGEAGEFWKSLAFGVDGRRSAYRDSFAPGSHILLNFAEGFEGDAVGGWDDEDLMGAEAYGVDGVGVDVVDVVAGGEDGGHEGGGARRLHGLGDGDGGGEEDGRGLLG